MADSISQNTRVFKTKSLQKPVTMGSSTQSSGKITPFQQMISSGSGALITSLFAPCYLFCNGLMDHLCLCANLGSPFRPFPHAPHPPFDSTLDALMKIPRYEGISALWRGLPPTLVMAVPNTMIYFTLYDQLKVVYGFKEGEENFWSPMCAGVTARTASITCISPIEMIRTKLQSRKEFSYKELVSVIKNAIQQGGMLSLWHGLGPTLLRDVPFSAVYWMGYEVLKSKFAEPGFIASVSARLIKVAPACAVMISTYEYSKSFFRQYNMEKATSATVKI
ncbi:hypothetical protein pdam_00014664 [Pocillopora damicornis]|uniref:Solute carrier family 25 member 40 n=1 Tax=Pocillopora damicornis TaxID=46731 RepID=A0A3M6TLM7_POCDA|nr:hypothetical protein pdam_00014664 [Pocillopora damicornis]